MIENGINYENEITCYKRGHGFNYDLEDYAFYVDNKENIENIERPCAKCGKMPTKEGHDACIANLPGVISACCGHGVHDAEPEELGYGHIHFENGITIRGHFTIDITHEEAKDKILTFLEDYNGDKENIEPSLLALKLNITYYHVIFILDELAKEGYLYQYKKYRVIQ